MTIFGLTGGIASGKSTVSKTFLKHNIPIVDADIVARQVVEPESLVWALIKEYFGKEYLNEDYSINRTKLGTRVFSNKKDLDILNSIMRPAIQMESAKQVKKLHSEGYKTVIYNAALICENNNADKYRPLIIVYCSIENQINRLMKRNNFSYKEAMQRINAQMPTDNKIKLADYLINTDGTLEQSIDQTEKIIQKLGEVK